jgi:uncharacterized protein YjaZ
METGQKTACALFVSEVSASIHLITGLAMNYVASPFFATINYMKPIHARINFYFPPLQKYSKKAFVDALVESVPDDPEVGFAGFAERDFLYNDLLSRYGDKDIPKYDIFKKEVKDGISRVVQQTIEKCQKELPSKKVITISIFPWLAEYKEFEGVNGFTPYEYSFILYISEKFSEQSLRETVAHEYNHALFFAEHAATQTLVDSLISEGLAENFREEVVGGEVAPWSKALTVEECHAALETLRSYLKKEDMYEDVFWKGEKYKKWTGYSIGYNIVKSFRETEKNITWEKLIKMDSMEILKKSEFWKK